MRTYSFGVETVPVALAGDLIVGSVHDGKNYRIMLAKLCGEEIKEVKFLSGKNDWEGHCVTKLDDGYLIGGAVEGIATPEGGRNWKAYLAKINEDLEVLWEWKYRILGNECVYSILSLSDGFLLGGEASDENGRSLFLMKVDREGNPIWTRTLGPWKDAVFGGLLRRKDILTLIGSVKEEGWRVTAFDFNGEGNLTGKRELTEGIALSMTKLDGRTLIAGYKGRDFWVALVGEGISWEVTLGEGTATAILQEEDGILVGGELGGKAAVLKLDFDGKPLWKKELWENGWMEALGKNIALGVREEGEKTVMVIQRL
ncbi:hypothetical protein E3E26_07970 [Thermococcus sp. LS1]|uniref:hypothetical protein n=1 Tax=Thermococcus sp. LS1 TaxID=1638259 RepID=UPI00143B717D|nr:hypothetical protein [Thermococcus sp. LS1]NJD99714.1 hypothetical protein [Thermococcus sp. LS1]